MPTLLDIANLSLKGAPTNTYIRSAETFDMQGRNLDFVVISKFPFSYSGFLLNKSAGPTPDLMVNLCSLDFKEGGVDISGLRKLLSQDASGEAFHKQIPLGNLSLDVEGSYRVGEHGLVPLITSLKCTAEDASSLGINLSGLRSATKNAFESYLSGSTQQIIKKGTSKFTPAKAKHADYSLILRTYAGMLEESPSFITYTPPESHRASAPKSSHVKTMHTRTHLLKSGAFQERLFPPTLVHSEEFTPEMLKEAYFTPDGLPTVEALYVHNNSGIDSALIEQLQEEHNFPSMSEVYK